ncbi:MAG: hypothetical protein ACI9IP_000824 [Arcticibacterium sp.]|jgi:hypothetical protein
MKIQNCNSEGIIANVSSSFDEKSHIFSNKLDRHNKSSAIARPDSFYTETLYLIAITCDSTCGPAEV